MNSKNASIAFFFLLICQVELRSQNKFNQSELEDFSTQAKAQVINFFEEVEQLGANLLADENKLSDEQVEKAINNIAKTFTFSGTVEERSKGKEKGATNGIRKYLKIISLRGQKTPVLISYDFIDSTSWKGLEQYTDADNNVLLRGTMKVRQYYCKLKPKDKITDKLDDNCSYSDTTDKLIKIEVRQIESVYGTYYAVLIDKIIVLSVK